ncbi:hypothetical protein PLESTF_000863000 [Pleodorina starrii]|nr:hypothetical protein PLESTF_000863000 [Pleodorina starrii]
MASSTNYELTDGRHVWTRLLEGVDDAATDVKAHVDDGHLLMSVKGKQTDQRGASDSRPHFRAARRRQDSAEAAGSVKCCAFVK